MVSAAAPAAAAAAAQPPRLHEATPLRPRPWPLSRCAGGEPGRMAPLPALLVATGGPPTTPLSLWQGARGGRADPPSAPSPSAAPQLPRLRRGSRSSFCRRRRALLQPRVPSPLLTFCRERGEARKGGGGGRARAPRRRGKRDCASRAPAEGAAGAEACARAGAPGEAEIVPPAPPLGTHSLEVFLAAPRVLPLPWEPGMPGSPSLSQYF